jgi:adenylate cyclase
VTAKILVVDDEPDIEALISQKFRREVREGALAFSFARDGVDALAAIAGTPDLDVVISDINMPRMDGLTLLQKLAESEGGPVTMIVSAYGDMANIRTAMNRGAFDFVTKPIDFADFETTLQKTLRHVTTLRETRSRAAAAERAHAALSRYFSPNLAERLAGAAAAVELGGRRRDVAAMFTDITGFTSLAESLDTPVLARLLHDYLSGMIDIVFAHEGTVAKIVGDALQVLFGAPGDQHDHAARAVACARDLDAFAEALRARWREEGVAVGATRIGVHAGSAIVGNFGGARFFDYTAYGDTINIAARLEAANKQLGTRVCVSAAVASQVPDFTGRPVGDLVLRGRSLHLSAYEPLEPEAAGAPATQSYHAAFALLKAQDAGAMPAFASLVGMRPDDALANFHLRRLLNGRSGTVIEME